MPLLSVEAMNASLDNDYGTARGPHAADQHELALFNGDPASDGTELVGNGYAPVAILPADWPAAAAGSKTVAGVQFPDATDAWDLPATHWALRDPANGHVWDYAALTEPIEVTGAGDGPSFDVTVYYADVFDLT